MSISIPVLTAVLELGKDLIDRLFPDKVKQAEQRAKAELEMRQWALKAEQYLTDKMGESDAAQTEINKVEAGVTGPGAWFRAGWRPATGWVCVTGYGYQYVLWPFLTWIAELAGRGGPPKLDIEELTVMLFGLLGLGVYRTLEKKSGVS